MLKKWKKTLQITATTVLVLIYVTIGLNNETLKEEERSKTVTVEPTGTTDKHGGTVKTIVGYSREFKMKQELEGRIECNADGHPPEEVEEGRWRYHQKAGLRSYSAFYDRRQEGHHYVRIIGLLPRNSSFYCQIWFRHEFTRTYVTQKAVVQEIWSADWGPKNRTCDEEYPVIISCLVPPENRSTVPSWVTFVDKDCSGDGEFVKIKEEVVGRTKNFVVCVKPLRLDNFNKKSLVEWVDINERLGADEIVVYASNETVLQVERELVVKKEFVPPSSKACPSSTFEESIWYKRKMEIIAYNDCFYRNLYHTKFVIPLDVDEIIVPQTGNNWYEAFRAYLTNAKLPRSTSCPEDVAECASFSVRNAYFFSNYPEDAIIRLKLPKRDQNVPKKLVKDILRRGSAPEDSIFDRRIRSYHLSPRSDSVKSFIHVSNTLSVFNHFAFHVIGRAIRQIILPEDIFQLNHYRKFCDPVLIDGCEDFLKYVTFDDSLERFRNSMRNKRRYS